MSIYTSQMNNKPTVYFSREITSEALVNIYKALNVNLIRDTAVKISSGEAGGHNFLDPKLIKNLVKEVNGTIVECNTAYAGKRNTSKDHWKTISDHGFLYIAPCDIMDEYGDIKIPVRNPYHLHYNIIGEGFNKYSSMIVLSHFKGHQMAGFGGALKNMSIGIASSRGKLHIHSSGTTETDVDKAFSSDQDSFLESMVDADSSVMDFMGRNNIIYINIANKISIDCDCNSHPKEPEMNDIGIFASIDPVAVDQACIDAVYNSQDKGKKSLIKRIEERNGLHILEAAYNAGLGNRTYNIEVLG